MSDGPHLPAHVTAERIEQYLDRIVLEVAHSKNPEEILPWYQFLEKELALRRMRDTTIKREL